MVILVRIEDFNMSGIGINLARSDLFSKYMEQKNAYGIEFKAKFFNTLLYMIHDIHVNYEDYINRAYLLGITFDYTIDDFGVYNSWIQENFVCLKMINNELILTLSPNVFKYSVNEICENLDIARSFMSKQYGLYDTDLEHRQLQEEYLGIREAEFNGQRIMYCKDALTITFDESIELDASYEFNMKTWSYFYVNGWIYLFDVSNYKLCEPTVVNMYHTWGKNEGTLCGFKGVAWDVVGVSGAINISILCTHCDYCGISIRPFSAIRDLLDDLQSLLDIEDAQKIALIWGGDKEKVTHFVFNLSYYGNSLLDADVQDKISLLRSKYNLQIVTNEDAYFDILNKKAVDIIEKSYK